jgi:hypothetical protein
VQTPSQDAPAQPASTRRVGHQAWLELPVRPWLVMAMVMTIVTIALGIYRYNGTLRERRLIESGTPVTATVKSIGLGQENIASRDEPRRVTLVYTDPKRGREISSEGLLPRQERARVTLGQTLKVKVDPENPAVWTERTTPPPLSAELAVPMLLLPLTAACWVASLLKRQRVAQVIRDGTVRRANVVTVRQSPLAPMSKQIGVVLDGPDRVVRSLYWPSKLGPVHPENAIDVIATDRGPLLAARSYVV